MIGATPATICHNFGRHHASGSGTNWAALLLRSPKHAPFLHGDAAEKAARYVVTVAPAGDTDFVKSADMPQDKFDSWTLPDGRPKQFEILFSFGAAEVRDDLGRYMVERGVAHRHRMLRKVRQLFDRFGKPLEEVFDERCERIFLEGQSA